MSGSVNRKTAFKNLKKKGFVDSNHNSIDHKYLVFCHDGKVICTTKVSHSGKDITGGLLNAMAKQIHLSKQDFIAASCTIEQDESVELLRQGKHL